MVTQPRRVLVVDDEPAVRVPLVRLLARAGFEVLEAATGRSAMELVQDAPVDLVLTDLYMPDMDGLELAIALRAVQPWLPIVVMSGATAEQAAALYEVRSLSAIHTITKPFTMTKLLDLLAQVWSRASARSDQGQVMPPTPRPRGGCTERRDNFGTES